MAKKASTLEEWTALMYPQALFPHAIPGTKTFEALMGTELFNPNLPDTIRMSFNASRPTAPDPADRFEQANDHDDCDSDDCGVHGTPDR